MQPNDPAQQAHSDAPVGGDVEPDLPPVVGVLLEEIERLKALVEAERHRADVTGIERDQYAQAAYARELDVLAATDVIAKKDEKIAQWYGECLDMNEELVALEAGKRKAVAAADYWRWHSDELKKAATALNADEPPEQPRRRAPGSTVEATVDDYAAFDNDIPF